jgi:hypothetical protein
MKTSELYKITLRGDNTKYPVVQCGEITSIQWKNENGNPFWLTYKTKYVIQNLREGKWVRVLSKKAQASFKRSTLFSFDDLD